MPLSLSGQSTTATFAPGNVSPDRAGFMMIPGQSTAPQGWLTCDGTAVSRTTYADLFAAIGTAFGVGDGSTTFNLPDLSIDVGGVTRSCVIKAFNDSGSINFSTTQAIIDSATIYAQLATGPSSPATGYLAIYAKNDGNLYKKTPAGVETQVGGGVSPYTVQTSAYNASTGDRILANTTGGAFTITLPASPAVGDNVIICDAQNTWATNNLTIARNGQLIAGAALNFVANLGNKRLELVFAGGAVGWNVYSN